MTKHRLELFSDGVFAIVLTLLVLDLRVPAVQGLAGLHQIIPSLLVHAASFYVVGSFWVVHYGGMARIGEIRHHTLMLNLLTLFWATLIPFAARTAAERPLDPLGPSLLAATTGFYVTALAWVTDWPAYVAIFGSAVFMFAMPSPPEVEQRIAAATAV